MNAQLLTSLAYSLLLTLIIETSFFLIIGKRRKKDLILVCLVNILTNPPVVDIPMRQCMLTDNSEPPFPMKGSH